MMNHREFVRARSSRLLPINMDDITALYRDSPKMKNPPTKYVTNEFLNKAESAHPPLDPLPSREGKQY